MTSRRRAVIILTIDLLLLGLAYRLWFPPKRVFGPSHLVAPERIGRVG